MATLKMDMTKFHLSFVLLLYITLQAAVPCWAWSPDTWLTVSGIVPGDNTKAFSGTDAPLKCCEEGGGVWWSLGANPTAKSLLGVDNPDCNPQLTGVVSSADVNNVCTNFAGVAGEPSFHANVIAADGMHPTTFQVGSKSLQLWVHNTLLKFMQHACTEQS
jgi:hypothetical protein